MCVCEHCSTARSLPSEAADACVAKVWPKACKSVAKRRSRSTPALARPRIQSLCSPASCWWCLRRTVWGVRARGGMQREEAKSACAPTAHAPTPNTPSLFFAVPPPPSSSAPLFLPALDPRVALGDGRDVYVQNNQGGYEPDAQVSLSRPPALSLPIDIYVHDISSYVYTIHDDMCDRRHEPQGQVTGGRVA